MKLKTLVIFLLIVAVAAFAVACGKNDTDDTTASTGVITTGSGSAQYPDDTSPIHVDITTAATTTAAPETTTKPQETTAPATTAAPETTTAPQTTAEPPVTTAPPETTTAPVTTGNKIAISTPVAGETYTTINKTAADLAVGNLILVNSANGLSASAISAIESQLKTISYNDAYQLRVNTMKIREEAFVALVAMCKAMAKETGYNNLLIQEGYRTSAEQAAAYADKSSKNTEGSLWILPADHSDYQTGLAVRFQARIGTLNYPLNYSASTIVKKLNAWLTENAADYGYILRYPADKTSVTNINKEADLFHYRYVGAVHALIMDNYNLCLEEYITMLKAYTADGNHLYINTLKADKTVDKSYEIYYVPATTDESGVTSVKVPVEYSYTVSGNNSDGFIVTVDLTKKAQ